MFIKSLFNVCIGSISLLKFRDAGVKPDDACLLVFSANYRSSKFLSHSLWSFSRNAFIAVFIDFLGLIVGGIVVFLNAVFRNFVLILLQ